MGKHHVWFPDEELWARIRQAAADESSEKGRTVSASEWLREAANRRLEDDPTRSGR